MAVAGSSGKGRYVACGLGLGIGPGDEDKAPTGAEKTFLENLREWKILILTLVFRPSGLLGAKHREKV